MIISLGILSVLQLAFLPGLIISRFMKLSGVWQSAIMGLALSPILNYVFVLTATALGIYNRGLVLTFLGLEVIFLIYLLYPVFNKPIAQLGNDLEIITFFDEYLNIGKVWWVKVLLIAPYIALTLFALFVFFYYMNGYQILKGQQIFLAWDAVVSWDKWAMDWYNNHLPVRTWHYPQIIPANWSLTYQFIGTSSVKLFAKTFMAIIEVEVFFVIFALGMIKRRSGYLIGIIFAAWLQVAFGSHGNGYVDTAVAFSALATVACLLLIQDSGNGNKPRLVYLGAILAAGAALTKQAGLWIAICYPLLLVFTNKEKWRSWLRYLPGILIIYSVLILPWYGYREYQIRVSGDESEVQYVTTLASRGKTTGEIFSNAVQQVENGLILPGKASLVCLCALTLLACKEKFFRWLVGLVIIPFVLIWIFYFSYDVRNLNLALPLIGLTAGIGCQTIMGRIKLPNLKFTFPIKAVYLLIPFLGIFLLPLKYPDNAMIANSVNLQKELGEKELNQMLYAYQARYGIDGKIITDYQYLGFLPGLEAYYQLGYTYNVPPENFISRLRQPDVGYALVRRDWMRPEISAYISQSLKDGNLKLLFEHKRYMFLSTCRGGC